MGQESYWRITCVCARGEQAFNLAPDEKKENGPREDEKWKIVIKKMTINWENWQKTKIDQTGVRSQDLIRVKDTW